MRSAGLPLTIGYTGHPWDRALGQYFAPFRYYNPATARWNMRDPLGFVDGPNVYAYVAGNPVMRTDPSGGWIVIVIIGGGVLIGGAIIITDVILDGIDTVSDHADEISCEANPTTKKLSARQKRKLWQDANPGQEVPWDDDLNRYYDMHHVQPT
ncbi:MAG: RHS repeat-associated core domain-containing protein [Candidatus Hydrogenedentes bacterium]|nr:RHS repeat-associated core domain-containing protein [Candidatus Hydrogenedentota bacterium]